MALLALCIALVAGGTAEATVLAGNTVWQGEVELKEDLLVPRGVTLTVRAGTVVKVLAAESTKTDPEFLSPLTEITVRGTIRVEGTAEAPVRFVPETGGRSDEWAGLLLDGGEAYVRHCTISGADSAVYALNGTGELRDCLITGNRFGITLPGASGNLLLERCRVTQNDVGLITFGKGTPRLTGTTITGNRKKDVWHEQAPEIKPVPRLEAPALPPLNREFGDEALVGETVWSGRIRVKGNVRVPEGSRLLIVPGTVVEFTRRDTNGDGLGENGLLVQGVLIAKGTPRAPIVFRSAEERRSMGDWDAINIMNSARAENLIENCIVEDAYRGLHFHFSTVQVNGALFRNNFRGVQFQESIVEIMGCDFFSNRSGVQGRDSSLRFSDNRLADNHQGVNFLRCELNASGNQVTGSLREAMRVREGSAILDRNRIVGNRIGLMIADIYYGTISRNVAADNGETGLAMKNVDNLEVLDNYLGGNGANGLNLQEARATVRGNLIAANAERGIGIVSFAGVITGNNIAANGLYAIELEGRDDVDARDNWWGGSDPAKVICDRRMDPARGNVLIGTVPERPFRFAWSQDEIVADISLPGEVVITGHPIVLPGATLTIPPGTTIRFADGAGLIVHGRLTAVGTTQKPITLTSLTRQSRGAWDELILEQATDSVISHTVVEYATWGIHGHFTNLQLDHVLVRNNSGGMRFRSGPVRVRQSVFTDNGIGIRSYLGNALFEENVIGRNEIGIFVRERGGGLTIRNNNLAGNTEYNIRVGDFNNEDIHAEGNWWGPGDPLETIFDGRREEGIGRVLLEPVLTAPLNLDRAGVP
jgi:parallel beta helix pectate lyase-like protein